MSILHLEKILYVRGYCLYSQCTQFVVADEENVKMYTLHPHIKSFNNEEIIKMPERGCLYSINESNKYKWDNINNADKYKSVYSKYIDQLIEEKYTMRWVGTMVADCHRTLLKGGVFLYPSDSKNPEGRIRLVYEAYPFAYIFMRANGFASNGYLHLLQLKFQKIFIKRHQFFYQVIKNFFNLLKLQIVL